MLLDFEHYLVEYLARRQGRGLPLDAGACHVVAGGGPEHGQATGGRGQEDASHAGAGNAGPGEGGVMAKERWEVEWPELTRSARIRRTKVSGGLRARPGQRRSHDVPVLRR